MYIVYPNKFFAHGNVICIGFSHHMVIGQTKPQKRKLSEGTLRVQAKTHNPLRMKKEKSLPFSGDEQNKSGRQKSRVSY